MSFPATLAGSCGSCNRAYVNPYSPHPDAVEQSILRCGHVFCRACCERMKQARCWTCGRKEQEARELSKVDWRRNLLGLVQFSTPPPLAQSAAQVPAPTQLWQQQMSALVQFPTPSSTAQPAPQAPLPTPASSPYSQNLQASVPNQNWRAQMSALVQFPTPSPHPSGSVPTPALGGPPPTPPAPLSDAAEFSELTRLFPRMGTFLTLSTPFQPHSVVSTEHGDFVIPTLTWYTLADVFPFEHNAIKVNHQILNASFLWGKSVIASIAPPEPVAFWAMVLQENCRVVVNLAGKDSIYFPQQISETMSYDTFQITCRSRAEWEDQDHRPIGTQRIFDIVETPSGTLHTIHHLHITVWPDRGVIDERTLATIIRETDNLLESLRSGPSNRKPVFLVHCSAGIGRTGTFLAGYRALQEIKKEKRPNMLNIVSQMKAEERYGLVQTADQYVCAKRTAQLLQTEYKAIPPQPQAPRLSHEPFNPYGAPPRPNGPNPPTG